MQDSKRDTDVYRTDFWTLGRGRGWNDWENGIETCIISYKKRNTSLGLMQDTGCLELVHWDDQRDGMGGRWKGDPGLRTRVHPWWIHVDV